MRQRIFLEPPFYDELYFGCTFVALVVEVDKFLCVALHADDHYGTFGAKDYQLSLLFTLIDERYLFVIYCVTRTYGFAQGGVFAVE